MAWGRGNISPGQVAMIRVYYDGKCGLCRREIRHYQRVAAHGIFEWCDLTEQPEALSSDGVSYAQGLKWLHAKDENGQLHVGVDAFLLIWRQLARWRVLAMLVALPGIRPLADRVYRAFAAWRFRRLSHCQIAANEAAGS